MLNLKSYNNVISVLNEGLQYVDSIDLQEKYYSLLGEANYQLGKFNLAGKYFEEAIKLNPENLIIKNNYSYYLAVRDTNLKKALKFSSYTIQKEPDNATYLDTYGWILYKMGKIKKAKFYIESALNKGEGDNSEVIDHYAEILFKEKKYNEALQNWQKALMLDNENNEIKEKVRKVNEILRND